MSKNDFHNKEIVFAITQHPHFGWLIEAFLVRLNSDSSLSMNYKKINYSKLESDHFFLTDAQKSIIQLIDKFSDDKIATKFIKKNKRFSEVESKISSELLEKQIKPYIEQKITNILNILYEKRVPLYFKGNRSDRILDKAINILDTETTIIFNFRAGEHHLTYYQTVKSGNQQFSLYGKNVIVFCQQPVWMLIDNDLHHFSKEIDFKKLSPFFEKEYILIPKDKEKIYFKTFIFKSVKHFEVNPIGFDIEEEKKKPAVLLKLETNWQSQNYFKLEFDYKAKTFKLSDTAECFVEMHIEDEQYTFIKHLRDFEFEKKIIEKIIEIGLIQNYQLDFVIQSEDQLNDNIEEYIEWINIHAELLNEYGIEVIINEKNNYYTGKIDIITESTSVHDWFDIQSVVHFEGFEIPFYKFRNYILMYKKEYELPDGRIFILPEEWFARYRDILFYANNNNKKKNSKRQIRHNKEATDKITKNHNLKNILEIENEPDGLKVQLREYQKIGFSWIKYLSSQELGCCLADDMGLGKTLQALSLILTVKNNMDDEHKFSPTQVTQLNIFESNLSRKTSLVVMPTSLIYNWMNEIKKFASQIKCLIHEGASRHRNCDFFHQYDLILTSYGIIRKDIDFIKEFSFEIIILDESQFIKNPESKVYQSVVQLQGNKRIILTGTPIENSLSDLWSQMSFINPSLLGSYHQFKNNYLLPIEKNNDEKKMKRLKVAVEPFILRRTKQEVAKELPSLTENIHYCEMTESQRIYYETKKSQIRNYLFENIAPDGFNKQMIAVLKALMQLRQIANHPILDNPQYNSDSGKFDEVMMMTESLIAENHKVLLFSSFVKHLTIFEKYFIENEYPYSMLTGSTPSTLRSDIVKDFQESKNKNLFLISIKAGGFGLNLTAADYVFILDPWWNPAVELQAINRAHRIGQEKNVFAYRFITKSSIEEKILNLQERKKELASIFAGNSNPLRALDNSDIDELFN